jgi:hypothetical protein
VVGLPELVGAIIGTWRTVAIALNRHVQVVVSSRQDSQFFDISHGYHLLSLLYIHQDNQ